MVKIEKKKLNLIVLILGLIGIFDTLFVLIFSSINLGTILPAIIGSVLVIWSMANLYCQDYLQRYNLEFIKKSLIILALLWFVSFLAVETLIITSQGSDENVEADYLLILGAGLRGENLSKTLYTRMETGLNYLLNNPEMKVIVSGGKGRGEDLTEAEAMLRFLVSRGIEEDRIIKEENSTSTFENFKHSKEQILKADGIRVLIVTNEFHIFRAKMLAERAGLIPYGLPSKTPPSVLLNCYLREYFAVIKSYFFDKQ